MEWFRYISNFKEDQTDIWNYDGSVLIDLEAWKEKEVLEEHLNKVYEELSIGQRKGKKKNITRFIDEVDDFIMQVGNKSFYESSDDYKKDTIISMANLWKKACMAYFNNEEGKAIYSRLKKNKNPQSNNAIIPFGPWIIWNKEDWEDVDYEYGRWRRLQKRNTDMDDNKSIATEDISQSQKDRGRKNRRNDQSNNRNRSRSRSRTTSSSNTRHKHNHEKTLSDQKTNNNQSPDAIDSDSSKV